MNMETAYDDAESCAKDLCHNCALCGDEPMTQRNITDADAGWPVYEADGTEAASTIGLLFDDEDSCRKTLCQVERCTNCKTPATNIDFYAKYYNGLGYVASVDTATCLRDECNYVKQCETKFYTGFDISYFSPSECQDANRDHTAQCYYNASGLHLSSGTNYSHFDHVNLTEFDSSSCLSNQLYGKNCAKCFRYFASEFKTSYATADECIEDQCHYPVWCGAFGDSSAFLFDFESGPKKLGVEVDGAYVYRSFNSWALGSWNRTSSEDAMPNSGGQSSLKTNITRPTGYKMFKVEWSNDFAAQSMTFEWQQKIFPGSNDGLNVYIMNSGVGAEVLTNGDGLIHLLDRPSGSDGFQITHNASGMPDEYGMIDNIRHFNYSSWTYSDTSEVPPSVQDCYKTEAHSCRQCDASDMNEHFPDSPDYVSVKECKLAECACFACETDFAHFYIPYPDAVTCREQECHMCSRCVEGPNALLTNPTRYTNHWFPFLPQFQGLYTSAEACLENENCVLDPAIAEFATPEPCDNLTASGNDNLNECIFENFLDPTLDEPALVCAHCEDRWATAFGTRFLSRAECRAAMCHDCQKCEYAFASEFVPGYANMYDCQLGECHDCSACVDEFDNEMSFI